MAKKQAAFVCADACFRAALAYGLNKTLHTAEYKLKKNKTVLADAMEAVLGAIFIDNGYETAKELILHLWEDIFSDYNEIEQDYKTQLQELSQAHAGQRPVYEVIDSSGPAHKPEFTVRVSALRKSAVAVGNSKKNAESNAAKLLVQKLR
jgi:ribonuclease-3